MHRGKGQARMGRKSRAGRGFFFCLLYDSHPGGGCPVRRVPPNNRGPVAPEESPRARRARGSGGRATWGGPGPGRCREHGGVGARPSRSARPILAPCLPAAVLSTRGVRGAVRRPCPLPHCCTGVARVTSRPSIRAAGRTAAYRGVQRTGRGQTASAARPETRGREAGARNSRCTTSSRALAEPAARTQPFWPLKAAIRRVVRQALACVSAPGLCRVRMSH